MPPGYRVHLAAVALFTALVGVVVGQSMSTNEPTPPTVTKVVQVPTQNIGCRAVEEDSAVSDPACDYRDGYWVRVR